MDSVTNETVHEGGGDDLEAAPLRPSPITENGDLCSICCNPFQNVAVGRCNHCLTCAVCILRLRCCYRDNSCPFCKTHLKKVLVIPRPSAADPQPNFELLMRQKRHFMTHEKWAHGFMVDTRSGYNGQKLTDYLLSCVKMHCTLCDPSGTGEEFASFKELRDHLRRKHHGSVICNVCHQANRYFPRELEIFSRDEAFKAHMDSHPICEYCNHRYFGKDELYNHMRKRHCLCQLCHAQGQRHLYFENVTSYAQHLREAHYPCLEGECADSLIAFNSVRELGQHHADAHGIRPGGGRRQNRRNITAEAMGLRLNDARPHRRHFVDTDLQQRGGQGMFMIDDDLLPVYNAPAPAVRESATRANRPWRMQEEFPALPAAEPPQPPAIQVPKKVQVRVECPCGRIVRHLRLNEGVTPLNPTCDAECEAAQHRARLAAAFDIDTSKYSGAFSTNFSPDLISWARQQPVRVQQIETQLRERIRLRNQQRFQIDGFSREIKKRVIELVELYGAVGRSVQSSNAVEVVLTSRCCLPAKKLHQYATTLTDEAYQDIIRESLKNTLILEDIAPSVNPKRYLLRWDGDYEIDYTSKRSARVKFRTAQAFEGACDGLSGGIGDAFRVCRPVNDKNVPEDDVVDKQPQRRTSESSRPIQTPAIHPKGRQSEPLTLGNSFDILGRL